MSTLCPSGVESVFGFLEEIFTSKPDPSSLYRLKPHSRESRRCNSEENKTGPSKSTFTSLLPKTVKGFPEMLLNGGAFPVSGKSGPSDAKSFGQQCVAAPEKSIQGSKSSKVDATKCSSKATCLKIVFKFLSMRSRTLKSRWFSSVRQFKDKVSRRSIQAGGAKSEDSPKHADSVPPHQSC